MHFIDSDWMEADTIVRFPFLPLQNGYTFCPSVDEINTAVSDCMIAHTGRLWGVEQSSQAFQTFPLKTPL